MNPFSVYIYFHLSYYDSSASFHDFGVAVLLCIFPLHTELIILIYTQCILSLIFFCRCYIIVLRSLLVAYTRMIFSLSSYSFMFVELVVV